MTDEKINRSLRSLKRLFNIYRYNEVAFAYNGGKDSDIVLHMLGKKVKLLRVFYFGSASNGTCDVLNETLQHIKQKSEMLEFEVIYVDDLISQLITDQLLTKLTLCEKMHILHINYNINVWISGDRISDGKISSVFSFTNNDYPYALRCNPIAHWDYNDVWTFIKNEEIKTCWLYNIGYTSLGKNARKNYSLWNEEKYCWNHASELLDFSTERTGRILNSV